VHLEYVFVCPVQGGLFPFAYDQTPITCRFGIKHTILRTHFDSQRNFISLIEGMRRWIIRSEASSHLAALTCCKMRVD
jgi:ribosomal protein L16 Arg81 hydroxylase